MTTQLAISVIRTDGNTQPRAEVNEWTVRDYAMDMLEGDQFPPIVVFYDGDDYWLSAGFHRVAAAQQIGRDTIEATVREGGQREAFLFAVDDNRRNGMRYNNADKRAMVERFLSDSEWQRWSDSEIARRCGVSQPFVSGIRGDTYNRYKYDGERTFIHPKTGQPTTMNTANIGRTSVDLNSDVMCDLFDSAERAEMTLMDERDIRREIARRMAEREADVDDGTFYDREDWGGRGDEPPSIPPFIPLLTDNEEEEEGDPPSCYGSCIHAVVLRGDYDRFFCKKFECDYHMQEGWDLAPNCEFYAEEESDEDPAAGMTQPMSLLTSQETVEWYTPPGIIERARAVLGTIDLDPASSDIAQLWIQATTYYTAGSIAQYQWHGHVWLNPPFDDTPTWVDRLERAYGENRVTEALLLVNSAPGYNWWEELWRRRPVCMLRERLSFYRADGTAGGQAKKGTTIAYYGQNVARFIDQFRDLGRIILPD